MTRVGVVLGAGGSFGWDWIIGALAAIHDETGYDARGADHLVGTSVGSLVGAYLGHGTELDALAGHVGGLPEAGYAQAGELIAPAPQELPRLVGRAVVAGRRLVGTGVGVLARRRSVPSPGVGDGLARRLSTSAWPARSLAVVAWSRSRRQRVVLRSLGPLSLTIAVEASCAVPGATPPVRSAEYGDLVDGGVHSMTNADLLTDEVDLVVVIAPVVLGHGRVGWSVRRLTRLVHRWTLASELAGRDPSTVLVLAPSAAGLDRLIASPRRDRVARARAETIAVLRSDAARPVVEQLRHLVA